MFTISVKTKKKNIVLKVFLVLLVLLLLAIAAVAVWQRDNIKAAVDSRKYTKEELSDQMTQSKQQVQQSIEKYNLPVMRDFTVEEEEKIRKGEMTVEEAMQLIMKESAGGLPGADAAENTSDNSVNTENQNNDSEQTASDTKNKTDEVISNYITQVYSLKAYYIGELGRLEREMRSVYVESGRDKTKIAGIVKSYLPEVAAMEKECDTKIGALLADLKTELTAMGEDTSVVDVIQDAYVNEKSLRKSYYLSLY